MSLTVEQLRLVAIARIAWESAQEHARQLREIEQLLMAGNESEAVSAMRKFFQLAPAQQKPVNGVTTHG
jgi:hypothetical protein